MPWSCFLSCRAAFDLRFRPGSLSIRGSLAMDPPKRRRSSVTVVTAPRTPRRAVPYRAPYAKWSDIPLRTVPESPAPDLERRGDFDTLSVKSSDSSGESMAEIKPSILKRNAREMTKGERARKGSIFSIVDVKTLPKRYPQQSLTWRGKLARKFRIENELARHTLAEFFATFYFMTFYHALAASQTFAGLQKYYFMTCISKGFSVAFGIFVAGGVSGGLMNPAINVAFSVIGKLSWTHSFFYSVAQYLGAFCASALFFGVYWEPLNKFDGGIRQVFGPNGSAEFFTLFPGSHRSMGGAFLHEVTCSAFALIGILAITDDRNWKPEKGILPFALGMLVATLLLAFGVNETAAMNPARDFAPRIFLLIAGYPKEVISFWNYGFFWIPIVGSHLGSIVGALVYTVMIALHHPPSKDDGTPIFPDTE
ncbi:AQP9 [Ramazzottius varieornatus]|uniref:AQP9 n=1 Tax=Ramazzottius varieornatus TaxID=947166 RepID=A0A1D1V2D8_RAMVA|nr:AQP9 [Ramazzottius varieornatus]